MAGKRGIGSLCIHFLMYGLIVCSCKPKEEKTFQDVIPVFDINVIPSDSLMSVGDTLWVEASFHKDSIREFYSGNLFSFDNMDFEKTINLFRLTDSNKLMSEQSGGMGSFRIINSIGGISNQGDTFSDFEFLRTDDRYVLKIGMVPTENGVFALNFLGPYWKQTDMSQFIDLGHDSDGNQIVPVYKDMFFIINMGLTNFHLFRQYARAGSLENPGLDVLFYQEQMGTFTFRVVD